MPVARSPRSPSRRQPVEAPPASDDGPTGTTAAAAAATSEAARVVLADLQQMGSKLLASGAKISTEQVNEERDAMLTKWDASQFAFTPRRLTGEERNKITRDVLMLGGKGGALLMMNALVERGFIPDAKSAFPAFGGMFDGDHPDAAAMVALLVEHRADVDACAGPDHTTALHEAASAGNLGAARRVLDCGASVDACDARSNTPLHYCGAHASEKANEIATLLLTNGADKAAMNDDGQTPLALAMQNHSSDDRAVLALVDILDPPSAVERARRAAVLALNVTFGGAAAVASSSSVAAVLELRPELDKFGLKLLASSLRLSSLVFALVQSRPRTSSAALAGVAGICARAAVEVSLLFRQPTFVTAVGGSFNAGDPTRQLVERWSRVAWRSTAPSVASEGSVLAPALASVGSAMAGWPALSLYVVAACALALALRPMHATILATLALVLSVISSGGLGGDETLSTSAPGLTLLCVCLGAKYLEGTVRRWPRSYVGGWSEYALTLIATTAKAIFAAAFYARLATAALEVVSGTSITEHLAVLPDFLFMGRQELSLFGWSSIPTAARVLIIVGDLVMTNAAVPPLTGTVGCGLLFAGLRLAGLPPAYGLGLHTAAWAASFTCHVLCRRLGVKTNVTAGTDRHASRYATVAVTFSDKVNRASAADLKVRVYGVRQALGRKKAVYSPFDKVLTMAFLAGLLLAAPGATHAAVGLMVSAWDSHHEALPYVASIGLVATAWYWGVSACLKAISLLVSPVMKRAIKYPKLLAVLVLRILLVRPYLIVEMISTVLSEIAYSIF